MTTVTSNRPLDLERPPAVLASSSFVQGPPAELPVTIIEPRSGWHLVDLHELWRHRELLAFLIWRDVKVRYKQTVLGAAWAIIQPLATMVVFTVVVGRVARDSGSEVPYPLFVFAGLLPWTFFGNAISSAGNSIVANQNLVTKVYFPRLLVPMGAVGACIVDFVAAFGMLLVLMLGFGVLPGWGFLALPALGFGLVLAALSIGTLLSALTVAYRDFRHVIPFLVQLWMFATPAIYMQSPETVNSAWRPLFLLNPVNGFIGNFRAAILGIPYDLPALAASIAITAVVLLASGFYFRRVEQSFADII